MFEKFKPYGDRVLVKRLEEQEKTTGGIFIPEAAKEKAQQGAVVAVGTGRIDSTTGKIHQIPLKIGDVVYFGKYAGTDAGRDHLIVREDEILGIVEK